jgi:hypothetical protein
MGFARERGLNRVTDHMYPEHEAFHFAKHIYKIWKNADDAGGTFHTRILCIRCCCPGVLEGREYYEIDLKKRTAGCMLLPRKRDLPIIVPGWEGFYNGNIFASMLWGIKGFNCEIGIEYMTFLADWYSKKFFQMVSFQIGSGVPENFPILRCTNVVSGYGNARCSFWSYCPDFRFHHQLRSFGTVPNYLGKIGYRARNLLLVGCNDCGPLNFCLPGLIINI